MIAWTERLNPVLVKEVRQSLRGRLFRVMFGLNLAVAALAAILTLQNSTTFNQAAPGQDIFVILHGIYAGCAFLLVPLLANRGMAAERDGDTYDALLISGLATRQIVLGKWLASGVLLLLFLSASAPFLALGFTLHGLDLVTSTVLVFATSLAGLGLCLVGILFATFVKNRALDTVLLGVLLLGTVWLFVFWLLFSSQWMTGRFFRTVAVSDFLAGALAWLVFGCVVFRWLYCLTVAQLSHPEENASTGLRVATLALTLVMAACCVLVFFLNVRRIESLDIAINMAVVTLTLANLGLITERDGLGRRSVEDLHSGRWRWPLSWMFLPGGGRGYAFFLAQLALFGLLTFLPALVDAPVGTDRSLSVYVLLIIVIAFTGFPSRLAGDARCTDKARFRLRLSMPMWPFVLLLMGLLAGLLSGSNALINGRHSLNPFWVLERAWDNSDDAILGILLYGVYGGLAVLSLLMNVRRMIDGRREVMQLRESTRVDISGGVPMSDESVDAGEDTQLDG